MQEMDAVQRGPHANHEGKQQHIYLKSDFNSPAGNIPWQDQATEL